MRPATRVWLGVLTGVSALLVVACFFSDHWYHSAYDSPYLEEKVDWHDAGGPRFAEGALASATMIIMFVGSMLAAACGLIVAVGTAAGSRRDHVPRIPALLAWTAALAATLAQAIAVMSWPLGKLDEPKGPGWAMPTFFLAGPALVACSFALWRDAGRRARASAAALAKVNRELAAKELADMPDAVLEEPVERV